MQTPGQRSPYKHPSGDPCPGPGVGDGQKTRESSAGTDPASDPARSRAQPHNYGCQSSKLPAGKIKPQPPRCTPVRARKCHWRHRATGKNPAPTGHSTGKLHQQPLETHSRGTPMFEGSFGVSPSSGCPERSGAVAASPNCPQQPCQGGAGQNLPGCIPGSCSQRSRAGDVYGQGSLGCGDPKGYSGCDGEGKGSGEAQPVRGCWLSPQGNTTSPRLPRCWRSQQGVG